MILKIKQVKKYYFIKVIVNIDIAKHIDEWYYLNNDQEYYEKYKHFLILGMSKEQLKRLEDDDKVIRKIKDNVFNLNESSEFPKFLSDEEYIEFEKNTSCSVGIEKVLEQRIEKGLEQGIVQGIEQGIEQGIAQTNLINAKKMKGENVSLEVIKKITGLDINTIKSL